MNMQSELALVVLLVMAAAACGSSDKLSPPVPEQCTGSINGPDHAAIDGPAALAQFQLAADLKTLCVSGLSGEFSIASVKTVEMLTLFGTQNATVSFPDLEEISVQALIYDKIIMKAPRLRNVDTLWIANDLPLPRYSFPELVTVGHLKAGNAELEAPNLTGVSFAIQARLAYLDSLRTTAGTIEVGIGSSRASLPVLEEVGSLFIGAGDNSVGGILSLPALRQAEGLSMNGGRFQTLDLPALEDVESLQIAYMPEVSALRIPLLTHAENIEIRDNPQLSQCEIDALLQQVPTATVVMANNGPACPP